MQVERDGPLVPICDFPPHAVAVLGLAHFAQSIPFRVLDLDHVGTEVSKHHARNRTCQHSRAVNDLEPRQRPLFLGIVLHDRPSCPFDARRWRLGAKVKQGGRGCKQGSN